jgi:hypothetical protein
MRKEVVEELVTLDAGEYWLGDPCYVIRDEDWMPWLEATDYQTETNLIGEIPGSEHEAVGFQTSFGDGVYPFTINGEEVFELGVDAGMIGFVPVEYEPKPRVQAFVTKVKFDHMTTVRWKNGNFDWWNDGECKVTTDD